MAQDAANVLVAATGAIYMSTVGATAPANSTAPLSTAWKELGFISEDGFTENWTVDSEEIKAWQNGAIVRRVITGSGLEFSFEAIETNLNTLELFYPGSTVAAGQLTHKLATATDKAFVFDVVDGAKTERIVVATARLSEAGERQYVNGSPRPFPVTIAVQPSTASVLAEHYYNPVLT
jgi:hypothetical protein